MPKICRPSNFVSSTTTSSGTRKMRVTVSEFGRFMNGPWSHDNIGGWHEGDSARWGQGHALASADDPHTETDRADLRSSVSPLSAGSPQAGARDRRSDPEP